MSAKRKKMWYNHCVKDEKGHEWYVSQTEHPFLTGWTCENCGTHTFTYDGRMPEDKPHSDVECVKNG